MSCDGRDVAGRYSALDLIAWHLTPAGLQLNHHLLSTIYAMSI